MIDIVIQVLLNLLINLNYSIEIVAWVCTVYFNKYISCIAVLTWKLANIPVQTRSLDQYITDNIFTKPVKDQYTTWLILWLLLQNIPFNNTDCVKAALQYYIGK